VALVSGAGSVAEGVLLAVGSLSSVSVSEVFNAAPQLLQNEALLEIGSPHFEQLMSVVLLLQATNDSAITIDNKNARFFFMFARPFFLVFKL
jgi:hypothetical protein